MLVQHAFRIENALFIKMRPKTALADLIVVPIILLPEKLLSHGEDLEHVTPE